MTINLRDNISDDYINRWLSEDLTFYFEFLEFRFEKFEYRMNKRISIMRKNPSIKIEDLNKKIESSVNRKFKFSIFF
jgi:hypothetical protein